MAQNSLSDITSILSERVDVKLNKTDEAASVQWDNVKNKPIVVKTINGKLPDPQGDVKVSTGGLPIGFEYFQTNPVIQPGSIALTGGIYSRETYKDFWIWIQKQAGYLISESEWQTKSAASNGAVPFYSDGDGTTTFRVPALTVWIKGSNGNEQIGSYYADSLKSHNHDVASVSSAGSHNHGASTSNTGGHTHTRGSMNITGSFVLNGTEALSNKYTGAFYQNGTGASWSAGHAEGNNNPVNQFDAARAWSGATSSNGSHDHTVTINANGDHTHTVSIAASNPTETETRPKTIVGVFCVIAYNSEAISGSIQLEHIDSTLKSTTSAVEKGEKLLLEIQKAGLTLTQVGEDRDRNPSKPNYGLS